MEKDIEFFRGKLPEFKAAEEAFFSGKIPAKEYKGTSGRFGSMAHRDGQHGMIRLRMCGGHLDKDKLKFIISQARKYDVPRIHTTTCETVQLHGMNGDQIYHVMDAALDHGIITQGAGGDNPRNVSATSLSGVEPGEFFDVYPYAKAAEGYLLDIMYDIKMPRKLKVTFSSSPSNETHATRPDGLFDVWSAGGLGNNPRMGCCVEEAVDPRKTLYYVRAMVDTFLEHGCYDNRAHARIRFMKDDLGEEGYIAAFHEKLKPLLEKGGMDIDPAPSVFPVKEPKEVSGPRIHRQKQDGLYYVTYHPVGGDPGIEVLERISDAIEDMDGAELRISPDSAIYIINLSGDEALRIQDVTEGGARTLFETSVSCIGGTVCQVGIRDSNGLLHSMIDAVREAGLPDGALPRFHISGCTSSCGSHQIGVIGLRGAPAKTVDGEKVPTFEVTVNGCGLQGKERFGDVVGCVPQDRIPGMVVALGKEVAASGKDFDSWLTANPGRLEELIGKYTV